jgi:hypothetical protein
LQIKNLPTDYGYTGQRQKDCPETPFGHWSSQPVFWETIVYACDVWFHQQLKKEINDGKGNTVVQE